jgi:hypothetical protein
VAYIALFRTSPENGSCSGFSEKDFLTASIWLHCLNTECSYLNGKKQEATECWRNCITYFINNIPILFTTTLSWSLVTMAWGVFKLRLEETASRYGE